MINKRDFTKSIHNNFNRDNPKPERKEQFEKQKKQNKQKTKSN